MTNKFTEELLNDYDNLLSGGNNYDVIIEAGNNRNIKRFHAHSLILNLRSTHFKAALSNSWTQQEGGNIVLKEPRINPKTMELLLKYIYTGTVDLDKQKGSEVLKLFMTSDKLYFWRLSDCIQNYVIEKQANFLKEDPVDVLQTVFQYKSLSALRDFYLKLICDNPEILFSVKKVDKSLLILFVRRDDLNIEEYQIWEYLLEWGIAQMLDLVNIYNISSWTNENFIELEKILHDFIPLIRWTQIPQRFFNQKISPFKKIFPEEIYDDIVGYYIDPDSPPKSIISRPRKPSFSSEVINRNHFSVISSFIDNRDQELYDVKNLPYSFELIYSATRDGFDSVKFHELCDDKGPTLMVAKIKNTGKLFGGYNPESWKFHAISENNFLFSFENQSDVSSPKIARCVANLNDSSFIHDPSLVNLSDLTIKNDTIECRSTQSFPEIKSFMNVGQKILMEDCEVFKVIKLSKLVNYEIASKGKIKMIGNSIIAIFPSSLVVIFQKFFSAVEFNIREYAKHTLGIELQKGSVIKSLFQRDKIYLITKLILRECANILATIFTKDRIYSSVKVTGVVITRISTILFQMENINSMINLTIAIVQGCAEILDNSSSTVESASKPIVVSLQKSTNLPIVMLQFIVEFFIIFFSLFFLLFTIKLFLRLDLVYPTYIFYLTFIVYFYLKFKSKS